MFWCKFRYDFVPFLSAAKAFKEIPHYVRDDGVYIKKMWGGEGFLRSKNPSPPFLLSLASSFRAKREISSLHHYFFSDCSEGGIYTTKKETIENYSLSIHLLKKDIIL